MKKQILILSAIVLATSSSFASQGCEEEYANKISNLTIQYNDISTGKWQITSSPKLTTDKVQLKTFAKVAVVLDQAKQGEGIALRSFVRDVSSKAGANLQVGEVIQTLLNQNSKFNLCLDGKPLNYNQTVSLVAKTVR